LKRLRVKRRAGAIPTEVQVKLNKPMNRSLLYSVALAALASVIVGAQTASAAALSPPWSAPKPGSAGRAPDRMPGSEKDTREQWSWQEAVF